MNNCHSRFIIKLFINKTILKHVTGTCVFQKMHLYIAAYVDNNEMSV